MRSAASLAIAVAAFAGSASAGACGNRYEVASQSAPVDATLDVADAADDGTSDDVSFGDDGGCFFCPDCGAPSGLLVCDPFPPSPGTPCTSPYQRCEYGPSWWLKCNYVVECVACRWTIAHPAGGCPWLDGGGACPPTLEAGAAFDAGGTLQCPAADCQYPDGWCECLTQCGGGGKAPVASGWWACETAQPGCPSPRPRVGTACFAPGVQCEYGWPCGCGQHLTCSPEGVWQGYEDPPCP